jgi:hypothetical protein
VRPKFNESSGQLTAAIKAIDILDVYGGRSRIRTYDFHRVKVALYR